MKFGNITDIMLNNTVDVCWFLTMDCQLRCPYCFLAQEDNEIYETFSKEQIDYVLKCMSECSENISINAMGGEPTLSPHFNYFLQQAYKCNKIVRINVFTNGITDLSNIPLNKKLKLTITYHSSQVDPEPIINNINIVKKLDIPLDVMVVFFDLNDRLKKFIETCPSCVKYPVYPFSERTKKVYVHQKIWPEVEDKKIFTLNGKMYSTREVFEQKLNVFTGWKCNHNSYQLMQNGDINWNCGDTFTNIFNDKDFFKNIKQTTFTCCNNDCVYIQDLSSYKWK